MIHYNLISQCIFISELGNGWGSALLESEAELNFIKEADRNISNAKSHWIGGSTNNCCVLDIDHSDYIPDNTGEFADKKIVRA